MSAPRDPITGAIPPEFRVLTMSEAELQEIVRAGVKQGVEETFLMMGVDISTPEAVKRAQAVWAHTERWYDANAQVKRVGIKVLVTTIATGALAALWIGFGDMIRRALGH